MNNSRSQQGSPAISKAGTQDFKEAVDQPFTTKTYLIPKDMSIIRDNLVRKSKEELSLLDNHQQIS
ncbi:hypothetical protein [Priestia megaterium]|uniref:hypothetical protein n=1 Tax=Priestia megaterium TaxID=1404 RepID=UPI002A6AFA04|nr:hypothetical protein [Priestia megaterium]MDY0944189.1 hypothetical protein [Priestia megaterium]